MSVRKFFILLGSLTLFAGCGKSSPAQTASPVLPATPAAAQTPATTLDGNWKTACLPASGSSRAKPAYFLERYSFTPAREFTFSRTNFKEKDCRSSVGAAIGTGIGRGAGAEAGESLSGTYELGNPTKARVRASGTELGAKLVLKRVDAVELNLLVNQPRERAGKYYLAHRIEDGKLVLGSPDSEREKVLSVDVSKVFTK